MARPPRILGSDAERVSPEYSRLLAHAVAAAGIKRKDLEGEGRSAQVIWRVLDHKDEPSFAAAERVRQRVLELRPGLSIPPPAVAVRGIEHYEWMKLGSDLMDDDVEGFRKVLQRVREYARALKLGREALADMGRLAGSDEDESDG